MKIDTFFFAVVMLSSTLVIALPLHQTKYSNRQAQEEYLREHGYYGNCSHDNAIYSPANDSRTLDSPESKEGWSSFEDDIIVRVGDTENRKSEEEPGPVDSAELLFWKAVRCFQRKSGLPQTGVVNEETRQEMETPSSVPRSGAHDRRKRFATIGKWDKTDLTYYIENYNVNRTLVNITEQDIRSAIQRAMKFWTDVSSLTVTEKNSTDADVRIKFHGKYIKNCEPFDGRGGTLAHSSYPKDGFIHLDADEPWSLLTAQDLLYVVMHEFGHTIGIMHSEKEDAVMWPHAPPFNSNRKLFEDDIQAVRSLYGLPKDHLFKYVLKYY